MRAATRPAVKLWMMVAATSATIAAAWLNVYGEVTGTTVVLAIMTSIAAVACIGWYQVAMRYREEAERLQYELAVRTQVLQMLAEHRSYVRKEELPN